MSPFGSLSLTQKRPVVFDELRELCPEDILICSNFLKETRGSRERDWKNPELHKACSHFSSGVPSEKQHMSSFRCCLRPDWYYFPFEFASLFLSSWPCGPYGSKLQHKGLWSEFPFPSSNAREKGLCRIRATLTIRVAQRETVIGDFTSTEGVET